LLIILNVFAVILDTVKAVSEKYDYFLDLFEVFSIFIFTVEYILRLWSCNIKQKYSGLLGGRIKFAFTPMALIDLFAILPFYLPLLMSFDMRFIRIIRLLRIFRLFKLGRYSDAYNIIFRVVTAKKEFLVISMFFVLTLLILSSSLMYFAEHDDQPEMFSSIPATMWWGIVTLTTVGYGDAYPITPLGKVLNGIIAFIGIGLFALPAGILASGFSDEFHLRRNKNETCPYLTDTNKCPLLSTKLSSKE